MWLINVLDTSLLFVMIESNKIGQIFVGQSLQFAGQLSKLVGY